MATLQKCTVCGGILDEEDLFCANCGTEAPRVDGGEQTGQTLLATHNFECQGCGASMSYDASAKTLEDAVDVMFRYQLGRVASKEDKEAIVRFLNTLTGELDAKP